MPNDDGSFKLLLVDDDDVFVLMTCTYLKMRGLEPLTARDGVEALELLCRYPSQIKLALVDLAMPVLNGFQLAHAVRNDPMIEHVPIIAVSALSDPNLETRVAQAGINRLIRKPFDMKTLGTILVEFGLISPDSR